MPIIAVLGATGHQGSGLIHALLSDQTDTTSNLQIRALTRTTTSPAAQALQKAYSTSPYTSTSSSAPLVLVQADVFDKDSLRGAFQDADAVFAMTNNRKTGGSIETEDDMKHELDQGRNIINAAKPEKDCKTPHLVLSSLPNLSRASNGRFNHVFHFDYKAQIEEWAREELPAVSSLHPGLFYSNMDWPQYSRWGVFSPFNLRSNQTENGVDLVKLTYDMKLQENGVLRFCAPVSGHQRADWVDPAYDIGRYAAGPSPSTTQNPYPVVSPKISFADLPRIFTMKTGIPAIFEPISLDEWGQTVARAAGKGYERDITQMMEWVALAPDERVCYGTFAASDEVHAREELGVVRASSFAEWLDRTGWRGPPS